MLVTKNYFHSSILKIDDDFHKTFSLQLAEGRFFDKNESNNYDEVLLNETAAKEYISNNSILNDYVFQGNNSSTPLKVVGIVKDFNFRSLHHPVEPLILIRDKALSNISVKIDNSQISEAINFIKETRQKFSMDDSFEYRFVDDNLARNYFKETQFRKLLSFITILAIFISCLGLFAISQITVLQKTKEIAVRKIHGAKIPNIASYLVNNFVKWVIVAIALITPVTWYLMNKWLDSFTYKIHLSWWLFALAGTIALSVAMITVIFQVWNAARRNPVDALRYE